MKTKWEWLDKPITWRDSIKACGISLAISILISGIYAAWLFRETLVDKLDAIINAIGRRFDK